MVDGLDDSSGAVLVASGDDVLLSEGFGGADVEAGIPNDPTTRFVLGAVIEHVSGMAHEDFLRANIFDPLSMSHTGYEAEGDGLAVGYSVGDEEAHDIDMSVPCAAGALSSTVADLLHWNRALASGSVAAGSATTVSPYNDGPLRSTTGD